MTIWCWVRDTSTGHHFDVPLDRLDALIDRGAVREIPGRRRRAPAARQPKPFRDLASLKPRPRRGRSSNQSPKGNP
jgi:hypothetical protein